jgi:glycosyltransferase involved in cell wall biosynthesis
MPIVVLEALACGLPVVTTDVGEVRRSVRDGVNGYIADGRSPGGIAALMDRLLANRETLAGAPCTDAVLEFTPQRVLSRVYENHRAQGAARQ